MQILLPIHILAGTIALLFADGYPQIKIRILPKLSILPNDRSSMK